MKKIFGNIRKYFAGVKKEFGRIRWTNGKDLVKYSVATISFMIFFGAYFSIINFLVSYLRSL